MKTIYSTFFSLLAALSCLAQVTITAEDFDMISAPGSQVDIFWGWQTILVDIGQPGQDNLWDFSDLPTDFFYTSTYMEVETSPYADQFPGADVYRVTESITSNGSIFNHHYYENGNGLDYLCQIVDYPSDTPDTYRCNNPSNRLLEYPVAFQEGWTTEFTRIGYVNGDSLDVQNVLVYTVDAYGTMILPGGIEEEALRIKIVRTVDEPFSSSVSYNFMSNSGALVEFWFYTSDVSELPDSGEVEAYDYAYNGPPVTLDLAQTTSPIYGINNYYPNPVSDRMNLSLRLPHEEDAWIGVFSTLGKNVLNHRLVGSASQEGLTELDMSSLDPGVYVVTLFTESNTHSVKVVKSM